MRSRLAVSLSVLMAITALAALAVPAGALPVPTGDLVAVAAPTALEPECVDNGDLPDGVSAPPFVACVDPDEPAASACTYGVIRGVLGLPIILRWEACAGADSSGAWYHCWTSGSVSESCPQP